MNPKLTIGRIGVYCFLITCALFFFTPFYVMIVTSFKTMPEIREGTIFSLPSALNFDAWQKAWSTACTGLECGGIKVGFMNSLKITLPAVFLSVLIGALNGYALSLWPFKGSTIIFGMLIIGAFLPFQVILYPLVKLFSSVKIFGYPLLYEQIAGVVLVHIIFGLPMMTLIFRNYYASIPDELFKAARIDGGGFFSIFFNIILPMSKPILIVAVILQVTGIWNDFILGLTFAGKENLPMTVQLNNIVNTTYGEKLYNVNMAATLLTSLVPMLVYFISGKYFVRGIAAGAVKG